MYDFKQVERVTKAGVPTGERFVLVPKDQAEADPQLAWCSAANVWHGPEEELPEPISENHLYVPLSEWQSHMGDLAE